MSKMVSVFIEADANVGYFGNIQFSQATAPKKYAREKLESQQVL